MTTVHGCPLGNPNEGLPTGTILAVCVGEHTRLVWGRDNKAEVLVYPHGLVS